MSKHRIQIDISFANKQDALDLLNYIEDIKTKPYKPRGNEKIPCFQQTRYHECTHDDPNPEPCKDYVDVDFDKEKKNHQ